MFHRHPQILELDRLDRAKRTTTSAGDALGPELVGFFKKSVAQRQTKLGAISDCWTRLVPSSMNDHCALESLHRGSLTVLVDSASHLYELKQLLLAGLEKQLLLACRSTGLKKIALKPGRWYSETGPTFDKSGGSQVRRTTGNL